MTSEEINAINRQIAEWLGWKHWNTIHSGTKLERALYYDGTGGDPVQLPDFYTSDSDAATLLPAIVRHPSAYYWKAHYNPFNKTNTFEIYHNALKCATAFDKQFSAAICQAVIQVIRKENKK